MKILCQHVHTIMHAKNGYTIAIYQAASSIMLPDGSKEQRFTAKGFTLPTGQKQQYELQGEFEKYVKKDGSISYTMKVEKSEEIRPTEEDAIIAYLLTLSGVGQTMAKKLYDKFGPEIFDIIERNPTSLSLVEGISKMTARKISQSYAAKKNARELFQYLHPYHIKEHRLMKLHKYLGTNAVEQIKINPYCITEVAGIGFQTAESIARDLGISKDTPSRIEAGIMEVLLQSEVGGNLFQERTPFPAFVFDHFLQQSLFDLLYDTENLYVTGNTYLPRDVAYLMTLKLLDIPISEREFDLVLTKMRIDKKVFTFVNTLTKDGEIRIYRYRTALSEYHSAKKVIELMNSEIPISQNLDQRISMAEKLLSVRLTDEQNRAVRMGITNPVSVITGGPGTGKTSILQIILSVYEGLYPNDQILLVAPTGRAAKRMTDSTRHPALTLHSALSLYTDHDGNLVNGSEDDSMLNYNLIIVDESSMIGSHLFDELVSRISPGTRLVLVGDVDQLPSIEVGAVLREIIKSEVVPITELTKTFRQASGSAIAVNAARIKKGVKQLDYNDDFVFIQADDSEDIAEKVSNLYPKLVKEFDFNNTICLSAYKRSTESGSNSLNQKLRLSVRDDITEKTPYIKRNGTKIYEGDRIMYTRNKGRLTNGDIGVLEHIHKFSGENELICTFNEDTVTLKDEELKFIELAYATTVHKSQGSEYKAVIMTTDIAHKNMLKRNLLYTGITRAKKKIYIVGQTEGFQLAIDTQDSVYRRSQLAALLYCYSETQKPNNKIYAETEVEQIKLDL